MQALLNTAVDAARNAGDVIMRGFSQLERLDVQVKGHNEFVTRIDHAAEELIVDTIRQRYPAHAILGEETGASGEDQDHLWIIDPLDGTTNYIHGFPQFCVSIGIKVKGRLGVGVVYDPCRQELFTAVRGEGAQLDGRRIRVSKCKDLASGLIGTGFPYRAAEDYIDTYLSTFRELTGACAGLRRPGSAALDLAYLAAGRFDGFWEYGLNIWDIAAGVLLVREAGGILSPINEGEDYMETGSILAGTPKVHAELRALIDKHV